MPGAATADGIGQLPHDPGGVARYQAVVGYVAGHHGTRGHQRTIVGELATIGELALSERVQAPALLVVGEVVRYREKLLALSAELAATSSPGAF